MKLVDVTLPGAGLGKVLESGPCKLGPALASGQAWDALQEKKRGMLGSHFPLVAQSSLFLGTASNLTQWYPQINLTSHDTLPVMSDDKVILKVAGLPEGDSWERRRGMALGRLLIWIILLLNSQCLYSRNSVPGTQLGFYQIFQQTEETESTNNQLSDYGYAVQHVLSTNHLTICDS